MAALPNAGGSQAHNNLQPFLVMNFIIALVGLYPSRG
jgi:microcystin-dependent protein